MASSAGLCASLAAVLFVLGLVSTGAAAPADDGGVYVGGHDYNNDNGRTAGSIAYPGQFPWHVAVENRDSGTPLVEVVDLLGAGVLISQRYVLTAASVVARAASRDAIDVVLGAAWLMTEGGGGETVRVDSVAQHPQWDSATAENDIATLKLETAVEFTDLIAPVRLPPSFYKGATYVGQTLSLSSSGYSDQYNSRAFLSVYNFVVIRNRDCQSGQDDPTKALPWTKLCAVGGPSPNPALRDGGDAALFLETDGIFTLVGIVSADSQSDEKMPSRMTRVTELLDWIKDNSDAQIE